MQKTYKFVDPDTGDTTTIKPEKWRWIAHYKDGSKLYQFDEENELFHRFNEIDQDKGVVVFEMVSGTHPEGLRLMIPEGAKLIHFYRNFRPAGSTIWLRFYVFGWEIKIHGQVFKRMLKIHPDNRIEIMDDDLRPTK